MICDAVYRIHHVQICFGNIINFNRNES
jgi:hypothetical protein